MLLFEQSRIRSNSVDEQAGLDLYCLMVGVDKVPLNSASSESSRCILHQKTVNILAIRLTCRSQVSHYIINLK